MTKSRQIVEQIAEVARDVEPKILLCPRRRPCRRRRCPPLSAAAVAVRRRRWAIATLHNWICVFRCVDA